MSTRVHLANTPGHSSRTRHECAREDRYGRAVAATEDGPEGQVNGRLIATGGFSQAIWMMLTGRGVAPLIDVKRRNFLPRVGVLVLVVGLWPAIAGAQGGRHHGGRHDSRAAGRPVAIVRQPVAVQPTVVVTPPAIVRQPLVTGVPVGSFGRIGFGTIPVRTGFGTPPVRTGFEVAPFDTRFGLQTHIAQVPVAIDRRHAFRSRGFRAFKPRHVVGGAIVAGYPVVYPYGYLLQYGFTTSPGRVYLPPAEYQRGGYGAGGVSAGATTYWPGISGDARFSSGLSFEVSPAVAEVYVDGVYAGTVQDFAADREPLMVVPGSHRIELHAPAYRTVTFNVTIAPGQVIPYEGELERLPPY